jgi:phosphohistidine phosphatase
MKLFVLRHGMTSNADEDADRELTGVGIKEVEDVIKLRKGELSGVEHIYSSPLLRVRQTLDIAARILGKENTVTESELLKTGSRLPKIIEFLKSLDYSGGDVLVSSHQSCSSILVLWITGEDILIPNGSLLAIDVDQPMRAEGRILWQESRDGSNVKRSASVIDMF